MSALVMYAANLVAIAVLVWGLYLPRHGRREMVVAYLGVNVGVLAVAAALATSTINAGLGLGLFGVLSIIRLRSEELTQSEVAYYFAALALGLIGGLSITPTPLHLGLMALIVGAVLVGDHPRLARRTIRQDLLLDHAITDPAALQARCERVLGRRVDSVTVIRTDLVNDTTLVTVRVPAGPAEMPDAAELAPSTTPASAVAGTTTMAGTTTLAGTTTRLESVR